jgi:hypothetical protein
MRRKVRNIGIIFLLLFTGVWFSCITDEFRVKDLSIKEEWEIAIITPLFSGNLEFHDLIHDWKEPIPDLPGPKVVLDYTDSADVTIPVELIFDKSVVIDSFPFLIQGSYEFAAVELTFTVENNCPYPLNLILNFYEKKEWGNFGPDIQPPPFAAADFSQSPVQPGITIHKVELTQDQLIWFKEGKCVLFRAWYYNNGFQLGDSISAQYPIQVSIVLTGKVKAKQDA